MAVRAEAEGQFRRPACLSFTFLVPVCGRQGLDLPVGRGGQALQHVFEIGVGFDSVHPAVLDQGVDDRVALARFFGAEKEPVAFSNGGRTNDIFDFIIVNLDLAVFEEPFQIGPLVYGIGDGLAHRALRQEA